MMMTFRRFRAFLTLISLCFLPACLGATGPAGNSAGGGFGDSGFGSAEIKQEGGSDGAGGITTDIVQAGAGKEHPGGSAAPGNEWQNPMTYNLLGKAEAQCLDTSRPLAANISF